MFNIARKILTKQVAPFRVRFMSNSMSNNLLSKISKTTEKLELKNKDLNLKLETLKKELAENKSIQSIQRPSFINEIKKICILKKHNVGLKLSIINEKINAKTNHMALCPSHETREKIKSFMYDCVFAIIMYCALVLIVSSVIILFCMFVCCVFEILKKVFEYIE
jgi:hypothetical protein